MVFMRFLMTSYDVKLRYVIPVEALKKIQIILSFKRMMENRKNFPQTKFN